MVDCHPGQNLRRMRKRTEVLLLMLVDGLPGGAGGKPPRAGRRSAPGWPSRLVRWPKVRYSVGVVPGSADSPMRGGAAQLLGRRAERDVLDRFLAAVRVGERRALGVRGEAGAV